LAAALRGQDGKPGREEEWQQWIVRLWASLVWRRYDKRGHAAPDCIGQAAWAGAGGARSGGGVHGNRLQNEAVYIEASNVTGNRGEAESINVYLIAFMNQNIGAVICFAHL